MKANGAVRTTPIPIATPASEQPENSFADLSPAAAEEASPPTSSPPQRRAPSKLYLLGGLFFGFVALLSGGFLLIKITNKDGTVTELKVPDTAKIEISREENRRKIRRNDDPVLQKSREPAAEPCVLTCVRRPLSAVHAMSACHPNWMDERVRLPPGALASVPYNEGLQTLAHRREHQSSALKVVGSNPTSYPTRFRDLHDASLLRVA